MSAGIKRVNVNVFFCINCSLEIITFIQTNLPVTDASEMDSDCGIVLGGTYSISCDLWRF